MKITALFSLILYSLSHAAHASQSNPQQPSHASLPVLISSWDLSEEHHLESFEDSRARIKALQEAYEHSSVEEKKEHANTMTSIYTTWIYRCKECAPDETTKVAAQCLLERLRNHNMD